MFPKTLQTTLDFINHFHITGTNPSEFHFLTFPPSVFSSTKQNIRKRQKAKQKHACIPTYEITCIKSNLGRVFKEKQKERRSQQCQHRQKPPL